MGKLLLFGEAVAVTTTYLDTIKTAVTDYINVANIVTYLAYGLTAALVLVLFWFGIRKLMGMIMNAFRKGKVRV